MKTTNQNTVKKLFNIGLILILVNLLILTITSYFDFINRDFFENGEFFICYIASCIYFFIAIVTNRPIYKFSRIDKRLIIVSLILFSISSFLLNDTIIIFASFTLWLKIYLVLFFTAYFSITLIDKIPQSIRLIVFFFWGAGIIITTYFAIYLVPLYYIAVIGFFLFGLSIHLLIPLFVTLSATINYIKIKKTKFEKLSFFIGLVVPLLIASVFLLKWNNLQSEIHKANASTITRPNTTLPNWVLLCQDMPTDQFSKKIIKGSMVYDNFSDLWSGWSNNIFDEVKKHDPLVNLGIYLFGEINLSKSTRVKILKSQFNARHLAQRKLWSGREVSTIEVLNNIKIYPDYRLAYTEKIITVKNNTKWETNQQEAAFTFYLPEGSVASSLSLWINGKEEKSRLTSKSRADSAYVQIVGVENRDPALLHWQEGNTLTVTVFPCTPAENRKFKIGITTPLQKNDDILTLKSVYFDGPVPINALETSKISFESDYNIKNLELPNGFKKTLKNEYIYTGNFNPYFEISCAATNLSNKKFTFNNKAYSVHKLEKKKRKYNPENIYLDINKSWTKNEYNEIIEMFASKNIFVFYDKIIKLDNNNKDDIFNILGKKNFSLFAFNKIKDWENSLVISKSTELSPNLSDLENTEFMTQLVENINMQQSKIQMFQIGKTISPYLKSLKEFQIINLHSGDISELANLAKENTFYKYNTDASLVNLDIANICIKKDDLMSKSVAPDHLLRLFAYNKIMENMGRNYFKKDDSYIDSLVSIANEAYIVSPVSSLIVLETKKDYDRFDIPENENSLKNASVKSSGSVPEPSEWLLISLFVVILTWLFIIRRKKRQASQS